MGNEVDDVIARAFRAGQRQHRQVAAQPVKRVALRRVAVVLVKLCVGLAIAGLLAWAYVGPNLNSVLPEVVPGTLDAGVLMAEYQADPAGADSRYGGRVVRVCGRVLQSARVRDYSRVDLETGIPHMPLRCTFEGEAELSEGQVVQIEGVCSSAGRDVALVQCVLDELLEDPPQ